MTNFFLRADVEQTISSVNKVVNDFVWGPVMLVFFIIVGIMFTVRTGFFQISRIKLWFSSTILAIFKRRDVRKTDDAKSISQFQALSTALAATIGTGNIVGVATAIVSGGPGAVFWMWLSAFFGMMTSYAENTLGIKYRYKNSKGDWLGGAMVYMEKGIKWKWLGKGLAVIFSFFCIFASFGIGNIAQGNSIANGLKNSFGVPTLATGIVLALIVTFVVIGGIKRIASVAEKVVPFMALFYICGGLIVIFANIKNVPSAFSLIFSEAFNFKAAAGGVVGFGVAQAMKYGVARGVFSNEAGLGSSVMVHSASDVKEPAVQGMWGIFQVFFDTLVVCTITALCILCSGVYVFGSTEMTGVALSSAAFSTVFGAFGDKFVSISITLFAFTTLVGWSYYGERGFEYLFGVRYTFIYKIVFIFIAVAGCVADLQLVWDMSDTFNGLMAIPNLIALTILSPKVVEMTKSYLNSLKMIKQAE